MKKLGARLKELRIAKKVVLREFCQLNGFDPTTYSQIERSIRLPDNDELHAILVALGFRDGSIDYVKLKCIGLYERSESKRQLTADEVLEQSLPLVRTIQPEKLNALAASMRENRPLQAGMSPERVSRLKKLRWQRLITTQMLNNLVEAARMEKEGTSNGG